MTLTLTPYTPRQQWGLRSTDAALPPTALRQMATGETEETARIELAELADLQRLIPTATAEQACGEAQILHALMHAYGRHRSTLTGGPLGIRSLTPRPTELVVRIAPSQLPRWIDALAYRSEGPGVAGLRWAPHRDGIVLTLAGMTLSLEGIDETTWRQALAQRSADHASLMPHWIPVIVDEAERAASQETDLAGIADHLSATLRRIRLVDALARNGHVNLFTTRHLGSLHLIEACEGTPTVLPLWTSRSLPLALWPAGRIPAQGPADPHAAVLDIVTAVEPSVAAHDHAALALCHLAGNRPDPVLVQAAEHALAVAARILADPAHASLYDAGGWAGSCRTYPEGSVHGADPCIPPGAEEVTDLPDADLVRIGAHTLGGSPDDSRLLCAGQDELVHLLDWALAAATRPRTRPSWTCDDLLGARSTRPLPGRDGTLELTASGTGVYRVHLESLGLTDLAGEEDTVEWEREAAPSQAAAVLLAEHAAIEASVCLPFQREHRKQRLLLPAPVPAEPTIRTVLAGADYVLGFAAFASVLAQLGQRVDSAQGAADGHWQIDPTSPDDPNDYPRSLTAHVSDWFELSSPHPVEEANGAPVDSSAYLRHLAAHRTALDPFVTRYLAAADRLTGPHTFEERHLAGVAALRSTDLAALACQDLRPVRAPLRRLVRSIPQDPAHLAAWYEDHLTASS
ncbi:hypothetical protein [Actinacidiphila sp. ITFR-21]|uniref:hypothetical protein n=1 Tax=Actinacidiphila sp. ITFR-21 TaxID=3075199 RepID=UPI00288A6825|nr:hypothetical protein [Streptomyces sp. ITFR-21]WNI20011.1 hypothetical protein RLT57_31205 [Streptomyces sp. ITFR-21]